MLDSVVSVTPSHSLASYINALFAYFETHIKNVCENESYTVRVWFLERETNKTNMRSDEESEKKKQQQQQLYIYVYISSLPTAPDKN